jgi:hypothetical protein
VQQIQAKAQSAEETKDDNAGLSLLQFVIQTAVEGFAELSDDDFRSFPMDELSKLSKACLQFSGLEGEAGK